MFHVNRGGAQGFIPHLDVNASEICGSAFFYYFSALFVSIIVYFLDYKHNTLNSKYFNNLNWDYIKYLCFRSDEGLKKVFLIQTLKTIAKAVPRITVQVKVSSKCVFFSVCRIFIFVYIWVFVSFTFLNFKLIIFFSGYNNGNIYIPVIVCLCHALLLSVVVNVYFICMTRYREECQNFYSKYWYI